MRKRAHQLELREKLLWPETQRLRKAGTSSARAWDILEREHELASKEGGGSGG